MEAFKKQIAGTHYKQLAIQPIEYILVNDIPFCEGSVIKYVTRWRDKGGLDDLRKAIHFIEFLIENEERTREEAKSFCQGPCHSQVPSKGCACA